MNYHVMIAAERRTSTKDKPRTLATVINADTSVQTGTNPDGTPIVSVTPHPPQLHTMGERIDNIADAQILYAASWDLRSPWITVLKGDISVLKFAFGGWPMVDQATWQQQNPQPPQP